MTIILCVEVVAASEDILDEIIRLTAGSTISYGYGLNLIFLEHLGYSHSSLHPFVDRRVGEDGLMVQQITLSIEADHLTTSTEARIDTHDPFLT